MMAPEILCDAITVCRRYKSSPSNENPNIINEEGFLQLCGGGNDEVMVKLSDQVASLRIFKLVCNCNLCVSYRLKGTRKKDEPLTTEPFMSTITLLFNTLGQMGFTLNSSMNTANSDGSNSSTWFWIRNLMDRPVPKARRTHV